MPLIGHVAELWRYPVKSMGGERCATLQLTPFGILGDRQLALESADAPTGKPLLRAAQRASMLRLHASTSPDRRVLVHTASGQTLADDDPTLPEHFAAELTRTDHPAGHTAAVALTDHPAAAAFTLLRSPRPLTDVRPVALHSVATIAGLAQELDAARLPGLETGFDPRRLRSNLVLDLTSAAPFAEDALVGHILQIGDTARLRITERIPRCRIVALAPETAALDPTFLRHLARTHNGRAGIYARPLTPGPLHLGDPVFTSES